MFPQVREMESAKREVGKVPRSSLSRVLHFPSATVINSTPIQVTDDRQA